MPSITASIRNSRSSTFKSIIRCGPLGWALIIGGIAVTVFSFLVDDTVQQFLTATFEEFWIIVILTLLSLCFSELRSTKQPCKKKMPEDDEIDLSPKKEIDTPLKAPSPAEIEERQQNEIGILTAQYMAAMNSGKLLLAEASMERLERLQTAKGRIALRRFCNECYGDLVSGFIKAGQIEKAKRWFKALVGTVSESRPGKTKDEQKRWQEIDVFTEQIAELVRKSAREGRVFKAESLLSFLQGFAPMVTPDIACFNSVISACAKVGNAAIAETWLSQMVAASLSPDEASFVPVINAYARKGNLKRAKIWLDKMRETVAEAQIQKYNFELVFQACGQMHTTEETGSDLRPEAPSFQPYCQTTLRAEAPTFELGAMQNRSQKTELRSEAPAFQSTNNDEMEHRKPGRNSWNWSVPFWGRSTNSQKKHEDAYSIESWGLLRATMGKLSGNAETPEPMSWGSEDNSDLAGMWKAGTGESYEVWAIEEKALLCRRGDSWEWKEFVLKYDDDDKVYWWGDAKKLYFDPTDVLTNRNEITWYRANDVQKRFPTFVWQKESNAVHEESAWRNTTKHEEPAWRGNAQHEEPEWRSNAQYKEPEWRSNAQYEEPEWRIKAQYEEPEWRIKAQYEKPEWRSHANYEEPEWRSNANYEELTQAWRTPKWVPKATGSEDAVQSEKHWQRKAATATGTSSGYYKWVPKS